MLRERGSKPSDVSCCALRVQEAGERAPLLGSADARNTLPVAVAKAAPAAAPTHAKILFLDGVRGLAALLVMTQHSGEYMQDVNLGACAVDTFFVLSSFLLTMLFMRKSMQLLSHQASYHQWVLTLVDYFTKRFLRVYPLFAVTAVVVWLLPQEDKTRYYLVPKNHYDLCKVLTFDFTHRYFVLWTLPLEISYYFAIPVFVLAVLKMRHLWWVAFIPLYAWVIHEGWFKFRTSHAPMLPHIPTFLAGSMAATIFVKFDTWKKASGFEFRTPHTLAIRSVELFTLLLLFSVCFRAFLFDWVHSDPAPHTPGFPFTSVLVTTLFVIEMALPSGVSAVLEWSALRYLGKVSFSVYLLHSFVVWNPTISHQHNYYDRMLSRFTLVVLLTTTAYHLVEHPCQLLAQRISRSLADKEAERAVAVAKR